MLKIQSHNKCGLPTRWWLQVFILPGDAGSGAFFFLFFFFSWANPTSPPRGFHELHKGGFRDSRQRGEGGLTEQTLWIEELLHHPPWVRCRQSLQNLPTDEGLQMGLGERGGVKSDWHIAVIKVSWQSDSVQARGQSLGPVSFPHPSFSCIVPTQGHPVSFNQRHS